MKDSQWEVHWGHKKDLEKVHLRVAQWESSTATEWAGPKEERKGSQRAQKKEFQRENKKGPLKAHRKDLLMDLPKANSWVAKRAQQMAFELPH